MKLVLPAAYIIRKHTVPYHIGFRYSPEYEESVEGLVKLIESRGAQQMRVTLEPVKRPRSTGPQSQNNHVWGHCQNIADQLVDPETGEPYYNATEIEQAMLRMSVEEGYPTKMSPDGYEVPKSFRDATIEEAKIVIDVIHRYADIHQLWLMERDPDTGEEYKAIGGERVT